MPSTKNADKAMRSNDKDGELLDDSLAFEVTAPFNAAQLADELMSEHGWRKAPDIVVDGDPDLASASDPVLVYVGRGEELNVATAKSVFNNHVADPTFGRGDSAEANTIEELREVVATRDLTPNEIQTAVRLLLVG